MAAITIEAQAQAAVSRSRWYVLGLLTALYTLNSIDRNVISIVAVMVANYGWRSAFFVAGIPGLLLALLLIFTVKEPRRGAFDEGPKPTAARAAPGALVRMFRERPTMFFLALAAMIQTIAQAG